MARLEEIGNTSVVLKEKFPVLSSDNENLFLLFDLPILPQDKKTMLVEKYKQSIESLRNKGADIKCVFLLSRLLNGKQSASRQILLP